SNAGVSPAAAERAASSETRGEDESVQKKGEVQDLAVVGPAVMTTDRVGEQKAAPAVIEEKTRADLAGPFRCFATEGRLGRREFSEIEARRPPDAERAGKRATARLERHANKVKRKERSPGWCHVDGRAAKRCDLRALGIVDSRHLGTLLGARDCTGAPSSIIFAMSHNNNGESIISMRSSIKIRKRPRGRPRKFDADT